MRVGIDQGAIVVLTTSTINLVMVVELMLPAVLPGALVALHYAIQILRPRWGHGADRCDSRSFGPIPLRAVTHRFSAKERQASRKGKLK